MMLQVFSVYDKAAGAYLQPFFQPTRGMAVRMFSDAVNEEGGQFKKHAEDFTLFHLAEFDEDEGTFTANIRDLPKSLGNALTFIIGEDRA